MFQLVRSQVYRFFELSCISYTSVKSRVVSLNGHVSSRVVINWSISFTEASCKTNELTLKQLSGYYRATVVEPLSVTY